MLKKERLKKAWPWLLRVDSDIKGLAAPRAPISH